MFSKFERVSVARAAKSFAQRTLAKKTGRAAKDEFPSDPDDLSDADFSDEDDRSTQSALSVLPLVC